MFFLKRGLLIFTGSLLIAIGINGFLLPFGLLEGGALGISLIFHYVMDVKIGLTFLIISIPIFAFAWFYYRSFFYNGLHGMLFSSFIIDILAGSSLLRQGFVAEPLMSAMYGGILIGAGVGIMLRSNISIGGIDLLAQMLAKKIKINAGISIFCFDIIIVTIGSYLIQSAHLAFSFTTVFFVGLTTTLIVATGNMKQSRPTKKLINE